MPGLEKVFTIPVAATFASVVKLFDLLKLPPLHPTVTGALLFTLTKAPPQIRDAAIKTLSEYASQSTITSGILALKVIFGLGLARSLNNYLSLLGQNNFRLTSEASKYNWPNEVAVVTGASGGIGAAIVTDFAAKGLTVIAVDIAPQLPEILTKLDNVHFHRCDITDRAAVMALAADVRKQYGDVSVLVNNAGIAFAHHTLNASEANLRKIFDVNIMAHYWTVQAFLPNMVANRKGHIVSTASIASFFPAAGLGPYSGTKVAALNLHESLQQELRAIHKCPEVLLTVVHPTFVNTGMTRGVKTELEKQQTIISPQDVSRGICRNVFGGRGGQVILSGSLGWIPSVLRSLPHWLSYSLMSAVASVQAEQIIPKVETALK